MTATTELRLRRPHGETSCKSAVFSPPPPLPSPPSAAAPHRRRLLHEDGQHEKSRRGGPTHDGRGALSRRDRRALSGKLWFRHRATRAPARVGAKANCSRSAVWDRTSCRAGLARSAPRRFNARRGFSATVSLKLTVTLKLTVSLKVTSAHAYLPPTCYSSSRRRPCLSQPSQKARRLV